MEPMVECTHLLVAHEDVPCAFCGRTLLTGERATFYLPPGEEKCLVCELCIPNARSEGWVLCGASLSDRGGR